MPTTERSVDAIAYQDSNGNWRVGPDNSKGLSKGQFIGSTYAKRARSLRKWNNDVSRAQRVNNVEDRKEAMELVRGYREMKEKHDNGEISDEEFVEYVKETFGSP